MTMKKHLKLMENAQNLNETFSKGDKVVVKSSVKNPQVRKYAGKEATVTGTEDDGKTIHAKVKGAKHGSMEFKASEIEPLNEDVSNRQQKRKEKNHSIISREEDKTIVAPLSNDALKHYARGTKFSGSNFDTYFHEYNIVLFFVLMKNGDKFIVPFSSDKDKVVGFYDEADTRISEQDFSSATGIKNIEQKLSSMHNKNKDAIEQKRNGVAESNLNEEVDTDKAKKDLQNKIDNLQNAMKDFNNLDDDSGDLITALPNGLSQYSKIMGNLSTVYNELETMLDKLDNAQDWNSNKL